MDRQFTEEETIRQYLLGTLPEPALSEIEEELFLDDDLSQTASVIEDEIIEQYLDSGLDPREKRAVEDHFLRLPAHHQKLRFARLLRHRFEARVRVSEYPVPPPQYRSWLTYGALAAAVICGTSSVYMEIALQKAKAENKTLEQRQEQADSQPPVDLPLPYGVTRGGGKLRKAIILPQTRKIKIDMELPGPFAESFDVRLLDYQHPGEQEIWSRKGLKPDSSKLRLIFDMPSQGIRSGTYDLVVSAPNGGSTLIYPFDASVIEAP